MRAAIHLSPFLLIFLPGCRMEMGEPAGPSKTDHSVVELDKAEIVRTRFQMGVGDLTVHGGAAKLLEGDFTYSIPSWKPEVRYSSTGFRGNLNVEQPSSVKGMNSNVGDYKWNVKLNDSVAQDFEVNLGAGTAHIDLSTANIRSIEVNVGVGEIELNLRGKPKKDYNVSIHGGVGEARLLLPKDVGVVANVSGGLGGVDTTGMTKDGSRYVNDAFKTGPTMIRINVEGGVGGIKLLSE
jgi:N-terminal domain of toast_rack, DUF2154/Cell wall-active antibiotics response 4TMS YvqF